MWQRVHLYAGEQEFYAARGFQTSQDVVQNAALPVAQNRGNGGMRQARKCTRSFALIVAKKPRCLPLSGDRPVYCQDASRLAAQLAGSPLT